MTKPLAQTGSVGVAHSAARPGEFRLLNGAEIIILAIKPSLCYVLFVSKKWLAVLLPLTVLSCFSVQMGWFAVYMGLMSTVCLTALMVRLAFALLQWQSRAYILTNLRILRIRGVLRVEMFQCSLVQLKDVLLSMNKFERFLGLGTIGLLKDDSGEPAAYWRSIRNAQQVHQQILQAIDALKGRDDQSAPTDLPPTTILPAKQVRQTKPGAMETAQDFPPCTPNRRIGES